MPSADERAFYNRIRAAPDDDGPRLIFADWLDEAGDSDRAEFIRLQCALAGLPADDPRRPDLEEREKRLRDAHERLWAADIAPHVTGWDFRRGLIDGVSLDTAQFLASGAALFDAAPIRRVRLLDIGDRMARVAQAPLLRHVRDLDLCANDLGDRGPTLLARSPHLGQLDTLGLGYTGLGDAGLRTLAESPAYLSLRVLQINDNPHIGTAGLEALGASPHLADLRAVDVSGNGLTGLALWPLIDGPALRHIDRLGLRGNRLGDAGTAALARTDVLARMVRRDKSLDLRQNEIGHVGAAALAEAPALAALEHLDLDGNHIGDEGCRALAASPHLGRLRVLSLRENRITDDGVRALARSPLMASLRRLDLTGQWITEESVDRLHEASIAHDWRGLLVVKADSPLRTRPLLSAVPAAFLRRLSN